MSSVTVLSRSLVEPLREAQNKKCELFAMEGVNSLPISALHS